MCGICAYVGPEAAGYRGRLETNVDALAHRGPDGRGYLIRDNVALGQTRLCVVGDAGHGAQPMADERYGFVFNGEIHNYVELARELAGRGIATDAASDTAVLFALLRADGAACLGRLRGFWAFVFVDHLAGRAIVARDRYGQKPLLYTRRGGSWTFASEARGLGCALHVDRGALSRFIVSGQYPAAPDSFYREVNQVAPGTWLDVNLSTSVAVEATYYESRATTASELSFAEATAALEARLRRSLTLRLRADVPVGLLLSAGKDSGTLAALMAPDGRSAAFTFSNGAADDEAEEVRLWYGSRFDVEVAHRVRGAETLRERVAGIHRTLDAPLASASLLALDSLYGAAERRGVPVLLSGQGADELLGGYHYYASLQASPVYRAVARLRTVGGPGGALRAWSDVRATAARLAPFAPIVPVGTGPDPRATSTPHGDAVTARRLDELLGAQLQTMLWYEDRIAMSHGIESRYPFLDVELVDLCLSLPGDYFVKGFARKRLLQSAFGRLWPRPLRSERQKRGLPAAEVDLIRAHPEWFAAGLAVLHETFRRPAPELDLTQISTPRLAKAIFRLSAAGHWVAQHSDT